MAYKLSERARTLLTLVGDSTKWEGDERPGKVLVCYFVPNYKPMWSATLHAPVSVGGSGDAAALKGLERKGLIQKQRTADYAYSITEAGLLALANAAAC